MERLNVKINEYINACLYKTFKIIIKNELQWNTTKYENFYNKFWTKLRTENSQICSIGVEIKLAIFSKV